MKLYKPRIADKLLIEALEAKGAVLIEGPKWCGKTTTASMHAKSILYMQDPAKKQQNLTMASIDPSLLLSGETPRLIDEWQIAPQLWDAIRFEVDKRDEFSQFILTGSVIPQMDYQISHTGTGRISRITMRTMTLFESGESNGTVSLRTLFSKNNSTAVKSNIDFRKLAFLVCRGGWPKAIDQNDKIALRQAYDYLDGLIDSDISSADDVKRDPQRVKRLLKSYARNISSQAKMAEIKKDMIANDLDSLDEDTIYSYINALKRIFVIEDLSAWNPNLRSKTAIRTSDTRHFIDPSIAVASLGLSPSDLMNDLHTFGLFFESMCIRDLRVYTDSLNGELYHYRDQSGLECDAVIHLRDGRWAAIEIKLGDFDFEHAAKNLLKLKSMIDTSKMKEPSFLMIITGTEYGYRRDDGIYVIPIGCLKD